MTQTIKNPKDKNLQAIYNILLVLIIFFIPANCYAVIGIYNFKASMNGSQLPVHIEYRLNSSGTVTIEILDESDHVVHTLGPFQENAGLNNHDWDGTGIINGSHTYRARIKANRPATGTPGTLECLCSGAITSSIYGIAVDKFDSSPNYGTIYVSYYSIGGRISAYFPDGSPKLGFGGNPASNILSLHYGATLPDSPQGIGVDTQGNIYTASKFNGIKVFNYNGTEINYIFAGQSQSIFWLEGLSTDHGLEVYETKSSIVRASSISQPLWNTTINFAINNVIPKQLCFEKNGVAMYVATSCNPGVRTTGVRRYIRGTDDKWLEDMTFNCGLDDRTNLKQTAAECAVGVSCDMLDPDGNGPYKSRSLWIALNASNTTFGGNIVRKLLPNGQLEYFSGPGTFARIIAADGVGNVAIESGVGGVANPWSFWGLYSPAGEASSDVRLTNAVTVAAGAPLTLVSSINDLDTIQNGCLVEFQVGKTISAVFSDCFYIEELNRTRGIRIDGTVSADEGSLIRLRGLLVFEDGCRKLKNIVILQP